MTQRIPLTPNLPPKTSKKHHGAALGPWPLLGPAVLRGLRSAGAGETWTHGARGERRAVAGGANSGAREGGAAAQQVAGEEQIVIDHPIQTKRFNRIIMGFNRIYWDDYGMIPWSNMASWKSPKKRGLNGKTIYNDL